MKVIVTRCDKNRIIKADMEREIERLFQENKDLRLSESHLRDELNLSQQQSEVRRQQMVEKDKEIERMHSRIATVGAERDNFEASYKQVVQWWEAAQSKAVKAEAAADEYRIALMESDCRVEELEKRIEWLHNERQLYENNVARLTNERDTAVNENTEMMFEINELQDKLEAEHDLRVEAEKEYDRVASEAYDMHKKIAELTIDNTRLENKVEELNELEADYAELAKTKREYGEEIDRLRRVVIELQTNRFTYDEFIGMIMKNFMPSTDK